jgi:hypothetical protein
MNQKQTRQSFAASGERRAGQKRVRELSSAYRLGFLLDHLDLFVKPQTR